MAEQRPRITIARSEDTVALWDEVIMPPTSASLLHRLCQPDADEEAWSRFVQLYTPLLYYWARQVGLQQEDASDLVQDVLMVLLRKLPELKYNPQLSFRGWLRTVLKNRWLDHVRRRKPDLQAMDLEELPSLERDPFGETEYLTCLTKQGLKLIQGDFDPVVWQTFVLYVLEDVPAGEVASRLSVTVNQVYLAKSRVLQRLRTELDALTD